MTDDITAPLHELRTLYREVIRDRKVISDEVKEKYREIAANEIRQRTQAMEYAFADRLRTLKEVHGLTVTDIQKHVFHTKAWDVWEKWKDLAGIVPEAVVREQAKAEMAKAAKIWEWNEDYTVLTLLKNEATGTAFSFPVHVVSWKVFPTGVKVNLDPDVYQAIYDRDGVAAWRGATETAVKAIGQAVTAGYAANHGMDTEQGYAVQRDLDAVWLSA